MGVGWFAWTAAWVLVLGIWRAVRGSARVLVRASNCGGVLVTGGCGFWAGAGADWGGRGGCGGVEPVHCRARHA
jgi:hypothetical protein